MNQNIARLLHSYPRLYIAWLKETAKKKTKRLERFLCCVQFGCENPLLHMPSLSGLRRHTAAMIMLALAMTMLTAGYNDFFVEGDDDDR